MYFDECDCVPKLAICRKNMGGQRLVGEKIGNSAGGSSRGNTWMLYNDEQYSIEGKFGIVPTCDRDGKIFT